MKHSRGVAYSSNERSSLSLSLYFDSDFNDIHSIRLLYCTLVSLLGYVSSGGRRHRPMTRKNDLGAVSIVGPNEIIIIVRLPSNREEGTITRHETYNRMLLHRSLHCLPCAASRLPSKHFFLSRAETPRTVLRSRREESRWNGFA